LWCLQMTEENWPLERQPHPYLPLSLQQRLGMPGANREEALAESRRLLAGLRARTGTELVFSFARSNEDLPQHPTTLLPPDLLERPLYSPPLPGSLHPALCMPDTSVLLDLPESTSLPLPPGPDFEAGSGLLTAQSACPFK